MGSPNALRGRQKLSKAINASILVQYIVPSLLVRPSSCLLQTMAELEILKMQTWVNALNGFWAAIHLDSFVMAHVHLDQSMSNEQAIHDVTAMSALVN